MRRKPRFPPAVAENVPAARRRVFGDVDSSEHTWTATLLHTLKHHGYEAAHEQLLAWLSIANRGHPDFGLSC